MESIDIQNQYKVLKHQTNEKEKYINQTSEESIEIINNWYQKLINQLIESQIQIIENIENERDRAQNELAQFDQDLQLIEQMNDDQNIYSIETKLQELRSKLSNYQIVKDVYLPTVQPRYKVYYQYQ